MALGVLGACGGQNKKGVPDALFADELARLMAEDAE
jgi:hypothetical protein